MAPPKLLQPRSAVIRLEGEARGGDLRRESDSGSASRRATGAGPERSVGAVNALVRQEDIVSSIVTRLAAASGAAYVVLIIVPTMLTGSGNAPSLDAGRAEHARWLAGHPMSTGDWAAAYAELLGLLCFIAFVATLASLLRREEGEPGIFSTIALSGGLISAAVKLASAGSVAAAYWRASDGFSPQLATALIDMNDAAFVLTWGLDGVMLLGAGVVLLRSSLLPRWMARSAIGLGVAAPLGMLAPLSIGFLPFILSLLWILVASVKLTRRVPQYVRSSGGNGLAWRSSVTEPAVKAAR
jgi:hypothetical protein